jgi:Transcriptional regulators of sugar metabolism
MKMKKETEDGLFRIERRNKILSMLQSEGKLMVNDTAKALSVTGATIRKDLSALEEMGLLERTHGGAVFKKVRP